MIFLQISEPRQLLQLPLQQPPQQPPQQLTLQQRKFFFLTDFN
jgi:hypothetical protein